jgi:hypothetical protein
LFTKRSAFFVLALLAPCTAQAFDNSACWHYAAQQGPRPDITCTKLDAALLQSLQDISRAQLAAVMNEPGITYPDGTLHYTGNDLTNDGGYQGVVAFTLSPAGQVTGIDAQLDNPTQGGSYDHYHWSEGATACSDLPGGPGPCAKSGP